MINNLYFLLSIGGASVNVDLLQILADIFAKPAYAVLGSNACLLCKN
jgi:sugar (pentulose or hexulose) kinase